MRDVSQGISSCVLSFPQLLRLYFHWQSNLHALFQSASLTKSNAIRKGLINLFLDLFFFFLILHQHLRIKVFGEFPVVTPLVNFWDYKETLKGMILSLMPNG